MAAYLGDVQTAVAATGLNNIQAFGKINARAKVNLESYTILGTEASGSTLDIGATLPANARVLEIVLNFSVAQTSLTLSIGDGASATRYVSASTGPQTVGRTVVSGRNYLVGTTSGDNLIRLTTGGATMTAGQLEAQIYFTTD